MEIEIDNGSGFCFGVTTAISKAEEELRQSGHLYCLGDIVHNSNEVERLQRNGLETITHEQLAQLHDVKVLLRAHGEPPETYEVARSNGIRIIDATCPVVLKLQQRIHATWHEQDNPQIVIYGKRGHAEVNGLVGQTDGHALVIESIDEIDKIDYSRDIYLYSQTTKPLDGFRRIVEYIQQHISPEAHFTYFDTICRQVANQIPRVREFAARHDVILFVCGKKSSNGRVLFKECQRVNPRSFMIESAHEIDFAWLHDCHSVGISGATSTPRWLMEECRDYIRSI